MTILVTMGLATGLEVLRPWPTKLLVDQILGQQPLPAGLSRLVAVLQPRARDLLPHTRGVVDYRLPRTLRGRTTILAVVPGAAPAETRRLNVTL